MKKLIAILAAALMLCALCVPAFAAADLTGHTYKAYKIFSGTQNASDPDLADIGWGDGIKAAGFLAALKGSSAFGTPNPFADCAEAEDVAAAMKSWSDNAANAKAFAKLAYDYIKGDGKTVVNGQTEIDAGYYLVVDSTADAKVYNLALLQQTKNGTFDITVKVEVPTVTKKVTDKSGLTCTKTGEDHTHTKACYKWADANKVSIGDSVLFNVTAAVPATVTDYDYYYYIVNDTLAEGLTYTKNSIKVTVGDTALKEGTDYSVVFGEDSQNFDLALHNAKTYAGKSVEIIYEAILNEKATVGTLGNKNEAAVKFSNNPNFKYDATKNPTTSYTPGEEGEPEDKDKPGFPKPKEPGDTSVTPLGETPKDMTLTYTTAVRVYKVDQTGTALTGAEFTLTGGGLNTVLVTTTAYAKDASGTFYKLATGAYTKTAPILADRMDEAEEGAAEGYVEDADYTEEDKVVIGEKTYRPYNAETDGDKTVYTLVKSTAELYDGPTDKYKRTVTTDKKLVSGTNDIKSSVNSLGIVTFEGLNAGEYTITESVTPNGYNSVDPLTFTITCTLPSTVTTGEEKCTWTVSGTGVTYNEDNDAFELTVVNQKGTVLPETGGRGTTLFYVLGGLLVVGAVVLLVVKKRMDTEK